MDSSIVAAGINAVGNLIGSLVSSGGKPSYSRNTRLLMQDQYNYSKQLMQDQASINNQQTINDREYNSPLAQINRLRAAGLNPVGRSLDGTAIQTPAVSGQSAPDAAAAAAADAQAKQADLAMMLNLSQGAADIAKTIAETKNINQQTNKVESEIEGLKIDNHYKGRMYEISMKSSVAEIEYKVAAKELTYKQKEVEDVKAKGILQSIDESVQRIKNLQTQDDMNKSAEEFFKQSRPLQLQQIRSAIALTNADIALKGSQKRLTDAQIEQIYEMMPFVVGSAAQGFMNLRADYALKGKEIEIDNQKIWIGNSEIGELKLRFPDNVPDNFARKFLYTLNMCTQAIGGIFGGKMPFKP